ncbi:uncharacterized protein SPPG_08069 [Spizellomyces punctatus DAOM BR117]|uniref:SGT1 protein n=1 Tax=Spizellomyces punctatus (strain DAOM BR117) TaxID=645134 RepID=A0A0L0H681_SPIPD|nr:uncharacterized protein SPPG_08069 [Spizellomyces punctatus DAOM BR117]KNC96479.1 hypothetical protein SPPG_08069 [Spizellomyces punctatus DAOM BR117]|eukprot:XP_016604519.1 hypothetical protein SPPG_08069 [Spizellomyces punctatus DAOM BR117]
MESLFSPRVDFEDIVEYAIYNDFGDHSGIGSEELRKAAQDFAAVTQSFISQWTNGYIWHKDPFELSVVTTKDLVAPFLQGRTRHGDGVEDEWFIVSLLRELTIQFPEAVVSVRDNDGEILLIEAAEHIPPWLDPSTSQNRVFLHKGLVHIIPIPQNPAEIVLYPSGPITLNRALDLVRGSAPTEAPKNVQAAIMARLARYPQGAKENIHRARCYIPRPVAHLLHHDPQLVASAVEAFYLRDPIAMKACYKMEKFPPTNNVMVTVRMNRTHYAQLVSQKFHPPKPFRLPPISSPNFKACELGMKLACGFEMLCADRHLRSSSKHNGHRSVDTYAFEVDPEWQAFLRRLDKLSYFGKELPGSELYKQLENTAKKQYLQAKFSESEVFGENPIDKIEYILNQPLEDESNLSQEPEDNDKWMEVDPANLDRMFDEEKLKMSADDWEELNQEDLSDLDDEEKHDMEELSKMFGGFTSFVEKESGLGGVVFPHERDFEEQEDTDEEDTPLRFEEGQFLQSMMDVLGINRDDFDRITKSKASGNTTFSTAEDVLRPIERVMPSVSFDLDDSEERKTDEASEFADTPAPDAQLESYMDSMDRELSRTKLGDDFEKITSEGPSISVVNEEGEEELQKVDLDFNLVKNILESFSAQEGLPGPASSILNSMGIGLPPKRRK